MGGHKLMKKVVLTLFMIVGFQVGASSACVEGETTVAPSTGIIFTCDTSTTLKNAWRDPDGIIWSTVRMTVDGAFLEASVDGADRSCKNRGFRLPTKEDFEKLASYLGDSSAKGYSNLNSKGDLLLPFLIPFGSDHPLWSSSRDSSYPNLMKAFNAATGKLESIPVFYQSVYICVTQRL
jgi:hypothetical protein